MFSDGTGNVAVESEPGAYQDFYAGMCGACATARRRRWTPRMRLRGLRSWKRRGARQRNADRDFG